MSLKSIHSPNAPKPVGPYSQAITTGPLIFTAGVGPLDPDTGAVVGSTVEEQTRHVLRCLSAILEAAGLTLGDVVKTTVHLQDLSRDFAGFNRVYGEFFSEPYPVRTTVGSTLNGILVEIDMVALNRQN